MELQRTPDRAGLVEVAVVLILIQGAILVVGTVEALVFAPFVGPGGIASIALTAAAAIVTLATAWALRRHRRLARRWTLVAEAGVLVVASIDATLSFALAGTGPGLVLIMSRIVIPIVVVGLLRRPVVRSGFVAGGVA